MPGATSGCAGPIDVTYAIEYGRLARRPRLRELSPVVFASAHGGDAVARAILDRLADELATMAGAIIRRLHLTRRDPDVVLAGGVFRAQGRGLRGADRGRRPRRSPRGATVRRLDAPPVLGAALLGLDRLPGRSASERAAAERRLRADVATAEPAGSLTRPRPRRTSGAGRRDACPWQRSGPARHPCRMQPPAAPAPTACGRRTAAP